MTTTLTPRIGFCCKWLNDPSETGGIKVNAKVQWVLLDHNNDIEKVLKDLPNLQFDTLDNVLTQFS